MNVEFRCPICQHRLMHPPAGGLGAVIRQKCKNPNCNPADGQSNRYVQTEPFGEAPSGRDKYGNKLALSGTGMISKDADGNPVNQSLAGQATVAVPTTPEFEAHGGGTVGTVVNQDELNLANLGDGPAAKEYLQKRIEEEGGSYDGRWGFKTLRDELFDLLDQKRPLPAVDTSMRDGNPD